MKEGLIFTYAVLCASFMPLIVLIVALSKAKRLLQEPGPKLRYVWLPAYLGGLLIALPWFLNSVVWLFREPEEYLKFLDISVRIGTPLFIAAMAVLYAPVLIALMVAFSQMLIQKIKLSVTWIITYWKTK